MKIANIQSLLAKQRKDLSGMYETLGYLQRSRNGYVKWLSGNTEVGQYNPFGAVELQYRNQIQKLSKRIAKSVEVQKDLKRHMKETLSLESAIQAFTKMQTAVDESLS